MEAETVVDPIARQARLSGAVDLLQRNGIKLVAFDMDQTAVAQHSRGRLLRSNLDAFLNKAVRDFVDLVPLLLQAEIRLAIATHSDEAEYGRFIRPETHILGTELASTLLERCFGPERASRCPVVAYNPRARGPEGSWPENRIKRYHVRTLHEHLALKDPLHMIIVDDLDQVINDCRSHCGIHAVKVNPAVGFQLSDLLDYDGFER